MSTKLILFLGVVAAASAIKSFIGYPLPFYEKYKYGNFDSTSGKYPFVVSLQWGLTATDHFCSGAILSKYWVITSGHCASVVPHYGNFVVKTGKHDLSVNEKTEQMIIVDQIIIHEEFMEHFGYNDVALLKLTRPISMNDAVQAIPLTNKFANNTSLFRLVSWVSNWRMYTPNIPSKLRTADLLLIPNKTDCQSTLIHRTNTVLLLEEKQFCALPRPIGGFVPCDSEPGAPLIMYHDSKPYLQGLVSRGIVPCSEPNVPLVFVDVFYLLDWIKSKL